MNSTITAFKQSELYITTPSGMEHLLETELKSLGAKRCFKRTAGVSCFGTLETAYRICLWSRLANRVLLPIGGFKAATPEALYQGAMKINWSEHLDPEGTFAVNFNTGQSAITHSKYGALKVKDAIVDQFRGEFGFRPSVDVEQPHVRINVYLFRDFARVSIDLSGDSLHKRGYRESGSHAPLKENLAAALLMSAGWQNFADRFRPFIDPMCGSGTLCIEAAGIATQKAPGLARHRFGFTYWKGHDDRMWQRQRLNAQRKDKKVHKRVSEIRGYDMDENAIAIARENAAIAGVAEYVSFETRSIQAAIPSQKNKGLMLVNPPYGVRLSDKTSVAGLYRDMGKVMKVGFDGWKIGVFSDQFDMPEKLGLTVNQRMPFYNGALKCELSLYGTAEKKSSGKLNKTLSIEQIEMLRNRLKKNNKHLSRWAKKQGVSCWRLYNRDLPDFSFIIDVYGAGEERHLIIQEQEAPDTVDSQIATERKQALIQMLPELMQCKFESIHYRLRSKKSGREQYTKIKASSKKYQIQEGNLYFKVNFDEYLDTGIFIDHRLVRSKIRELSKNRHFLNLFAYTGTASVYAADGGAKSTLTIDLSNTYINWAKENMHLNGFDQECHQFMQADCLNWLKENEGEESFDLVFLDPPTFSNSKRMQETLDIQRDHVQIINRTMSIINPDGKLIFSTNKRNFKLDEREINASSISNITRNTISEDFIRAAQPHQCWIIQKEG